ncbi:MAG: penicillin-binding protein 1C, partial [Desulfovibrio sp.]|nr:penicillin-binding protein 1C [Desulfovibrio sp.]
FWESLLFVPLDPPLAKTDFSDVVCDRKGRILRITVTKDEKYRLYTPLESIPSWALNRVIAYEDKWFWQHPGVNIASLVRSLLAMLRGGRRMGGSTLTMQTARLAYHLHTATLWGKVRQIFLALCLERQFSKADILEAYFSLAPYGGNVEGLASAARIYFHKSPHELTREEAEALMLVPQNPVQRRPSMNNPHFQKARARLKTRDEEEAPLRIYGLGDIPFRAPHFVQEILRSHSWTKEADDAAARATRYAPKRTSLDLDLQTMLEEQIRRFVARNAVFGLHNASALLVHWPSNEVRALVGSADFWNTQIDGQIDATKIRRSPGSTLKPFIYALALEQGFIHPRSILADTPQSFQGYDPENFDRTFKGPIPAEYALRSSRNLPAIALAQKLRNPDLYTFLKNAGVHLQKSNEHYGLALVLGGAEVTVREEGMLYSMLANKGIVRELSFFEGEKKPGRSVLSPEAAYVTCAMLTDPDRSSRLYTQKGPSLSVRCKTGTSNGFRDAWTSGIFGPYVLIVWVGNCNNSANPLLVGGRVAEPLFMEMARVIAASDALKDPLATPDPSLHITRLPVCRVSGYLDISLCQDTVDTWFIPGVSPIKKTGILRRITISTESGLQACYPEEGKTEEIVWEFWPSDLATLFARAGIPKAPPPPFEPACAAKEPGEAPRIVSPKRGLTYYSSLRQEKKAHLVFMAHADALAKELNWYVNGLFVGKTEPGKALAYEREPGLYHVMVVDDLGRTSTVSVTIQAAP